MGALAHATRLPTRSGPFLRQGHLLAMVIGVCVYTTN